MYRIVHACGWMEVGYIPSILVGWGAYTHCACAVSDYRVDQKKSTARLRVEVRGQFRGQHFHFVKKIEETIYQWRKFESTYLTGTISAKRLKVQIVVCLRFLVADKTHNLGLLGSGSGTPPPSPSASSVEGVNIQPGGIRPLLRTGVHRPSVQPHPQKHVRVFISTTLHSELTIDLIYNLNLSQNATFDVLTFILWGKYPDPSPRESFSMTQGLRPLTRFSPYHNPAGEK